MEHPLAKKLNNVKAVYTTQGGYYSLAAFPKIYQGTFSSRRDVYVIINIAMATER